jgi:serine phosphatase RsbU (regulator of sigma subunit)
MSAEPHVRLTVLQPNVAPAHLTFEAQTISLGRASECTIPIRDRFLSRRHAEIVWQDGEWVVRDCGSVNGTMLNGRKVMMPTPLRAGDRIELGDSEVVFDGTDMPSQLIPVDSNSHATQLSIPLQKALEDDLTARGPERTRIINSLALELIEDRPMSELFDFILDRIADLLKPSRCAIALFGPDRKSFATLKLRQAPNESSGDLAISKTLLHEVVEERKVISFVDASDDGRLAQAVSMIAQQIRAAVCAPLLVGDDVLGVLYLDYRASHGVVNEGDIRLIAQIARFAATKLETTRLREEAIEKAKFEQELRMAYVIQSRLLPATLPAVDGYCFAGVNKPCRTVSGDYYDVIARPDGRIYFVIADVSGKGITAALVMTGLATAFNIFAKSDPTPAQLARELNMTLAPKTAPTKFATVFVGVLDPRSGVVDFANAGHVPPLVVGRDGVTTLDQTDLVVGLFAHAQYHDQSVALGPGDSLVMFTDGISEAENPEEQQLGIGPVSDLLKPLHGCAAPKLLETIDAHLHDYVAGAPLADDVTMLAITRER